MLEFEKGFESVNKTFRIPVHIVEQRIEDWQQQALVGQYDGGVLSLVFVFVFVFFAHQLPDYFACGFGLLNVFRAVDDVYFSVAL